MSIFRALFWLKPDVASAGVTESIAKLNLQGVAASTIWFLSKTGFIFIIDRDVAEATFAIVHQLLKARCGLYGKLQINAVALPPMDASRAVVSRPNLLPAGATQLPENARWVAARWRLRKPFKAFL